MKHFYERNIIEIKKEYETFLINIISPLIYEGFLSLYKESKKYHEELKKKTRNTQNKIPSILQIFQIYIKSISSWTNNTISKETNRIRESSKCSDSFDDLIKAVIKSYIVLLTFNISNKESDIVNKRYHENININEFIHKCYIETGRALYDFPEIFWDKFTSIEIKKNQRECLEIIKKSIKEAIRKLLPMKLILNEYLQNDYTKENSDKIQSIPLSAYNNLKEMLRKDILNDKKDTKKYSEDSDRKYYDRSYSKNSSSSSDSSSSDTYSSTDKKDMDYLRNKINDMNSTKKNISSKDDFKKLINLGDKKEQYKQEQYKQEQYKQEQYKQEQDKKEQDKRDQDKDNQKYILDNKPTQQINQPTNINVINKNTSIPENKNLNVVDNKINEVNNKDIFTKIQDKNNPLETKNNTEPNQIINNNINPIVNNESKPDIKVIEDKNIENKSNQVVVGNSNLNIEKKDIENEVNKEKENFFNKLL